MQVRAFSSWIESPGDPETARRRAIATLLLVLVFLGVNLAVPLGNRGCSLVSLWF
jgi:hypothetical protein